MTTPVVDCTETFYISSKALVAQSWPVCRTSADSYESLLSFFSSSHLSYFSSFFFSYLQLLEMSSSGEHSHSSSREYTLFIVFCALAG